MSHIKNHQSHKSGNVVVGLIVTIAVIWGIYHFYQNKKQNDEYNSVMQEHPNYESYKETKDCSSLAPDNPYDEGSGHYAGFEWGAEGNMCNGNSDSFIEGCEDYEIQEQAYSACLASQNN